MQTFTFEYEIRLNIRLTASEAEVLRNTAIRHHLGAADVIAILVRGANTDKTIHDDTDVAWATPVSWREIDLLRKCLELAGGFRPRTDHGPLVPGAPDYNVAALALDKKLLACQLAITEEATRLAIGRPVAATLREIP